MKNMPSSIFFSKPLTVFCECIPQSKQQGRGLHGQQLDQWVLANISRSNVTQSSRQIDCFIITFWHTTVMLWYEGCAKIVCDPFGLPGVMIPAHFQSQPKEKGGCVWWGERTFKDF